MGRRSYVSFFLAKNVPIADCVKKKQNDLVYRNTHLYIHN